MMATFKRHAAQRDMGALTWVQPGKANMLIPRDREVRMGQHACRGQHPLAH